MNLLSRRALLRRVGIDDELDEALDAELAEARRSYEASVPGLLDEISRALVAGAFEDARKIAHRIRGTAGCYGMLDVSAVAGELEDVLTDASTSRDAATLETYVARARRALGR